MSNSANPKLKATYDDILSLEAAKDDIAEQIKDAYKAAKEGGDIDVKALRASIRVGKATTAKRAKMLEDQEMLDAYLVALGLA